MGKGILRVPRLKFLNPGVEFGNLRMVDGDNCIHPRQVGVKADGFIGQTLAFFGLAMAHSNKSEGLGVFFILRTAGDGIQIRITVGPCDMDKVLPLDQ